MKPVLKSSEMGINSLLKEVFKFLLV